MAVGSQQIIASLLLLVVAISAASFILAFYSGIGEEVPQRLTPQRGESYVYPRIINVTRELNTDTNSYRVCAFVYNTLPYDVNITQARLIVENGGTKMYVPSSTCTTIASGETCPLCLPTNLPPGTYRLFALLRGIKSLPEQIVLPVPPRPDVTIKGVLFYNDLPMSDPADRYRNIVFSGDYNRVFLEVQLENVGKAPAEVNVYVDSSAFEFNYCSVTILPGALVTCTLEGNALLPGNVEVNVIAEDPGDANIANNVYSTTVAVWPIAFCYSCAECSAELNSLAYQSANLSVPALVVLGADLSATGTCISLSVLSPYGLYFDGNGHAISATQNAIYLYGVKSTRFRYLSASTTATSSITTPYAAFYVDRSDVQLEHATLYAPNAYSIYMYGGTTLTLLDVNAGDLYSYTSLGYNTLYVYLDEGNVYVCPSTTGATGGWVGGGLLVYLNYCSGGTFYTTILGTTTVYYYDSCSTTNIAACP